MMIVSSVSLVILLDIVATPRLTGVEGFEPPVSSLEDWCFIRVKLYAHFRVWGRGLEPLNPYGKRS